MSIQIRVALIIFVAALFIGVARWVIQGKFQLKYSFMWLVFSSFMLIAAIFPQFVSDLSTLMGFVTSSNFVLYVAVALLLMICVSLTAIVSWQSRDIRVLIQRVALLEKDYKELLGKKRAEEDAKDSNDTTQKSQA